MRRSLMMKELKICALAQGYGRGLKPWINYPMIDLIVFADLMDILNSSERSNKQ
jgi:hypothetical protein